MTQNISISITAKFDERQKAQTWRSTELEQYCSEFKHKFGRYPLDVM